MSSGGGSSDWVGTTLLSRSDGRCSSRLRGSVHEFGQSPWTFLDRDEWGVAKGYSVTDMGSGRVGFKIRTVQMDVFHHSFVVMTSADTAGHSCPGA